MYFISSFSFHLSSLKRRSTNTNKHQHHQNANNPKLAGMLLPALNSAREKARNASCRNNLKQLGLMINQYCDNNGGYFIQLDGDNSWTGFIARDQMNPFVNLLSKGDPLQLKKGTGGSLAYCPSAKDIDPILAANTRYLNHTGHNIVSYGYAYRGPAAWLDNPKRDKIRFSGTGSGDPSSAKLNQIPFPSGTFAFAESSRIFTGSADGYWCLYMDKGAISNRHNNMPNLLYIDGHVNATPYARFKAWEAAATNNANTKGMRKDYCEYPD